MSKINKPTRFQKSTISIVIISAVTVGLITLEKSVNQNDLFLTQHNFLQQYIEREKPHTKTITSTDDAEIALAPLVEVLELTQPVTQPPVKAIQIEHPVELVNHNITDTAITNTTIENTRITDADINQKVLFDFSSSEIGPEYYQALLETAKLINNSNADDQTLWQVVGYADLTGNHQFNIELAKRRAQAVAMFLVDKGVNEAQLSIVSLGDTNPTQADRKRGANQLDRRVEIHSYQAEITALAEQLSIQNRKMNKVLAATAEQKIDMQIFEINSATKVFALQKTVEKELIEHQVPAISNLLTSSTQIDF